MTSEELFSDKEDSKAGNGKTKALYVQLKPELHEQLTLLAKVKGNALAKEIREALEAHVEASKANPELASQAETVLADIEREMAERKAAIANLLGSEQSQSSTGSKAKGKKTAKGDASS